MPAVLRKRLSICLSERIFLKNRVSFAMLPAEYRVFGFRAFIALLITSAIILGSDAFSYC
jgi:hypothetical protein